MSIYSQALIDSIITFPLEFRVGKFSLNAHLLLETLSFFIGFRYFLYLRKKEPDLISSSDRVWILIGATFGAFFFSRLIGGLETPDSFFNPDQSFIYYYANKTIIGGLLGALLCVEITKAIIGVKSSSGDLFTYPLILAMIIGRIGCFSAGISEQTYGVESSLPWAIDLGDGLLRHPVALYEIIFLILLWIGLGKLENKVSLSNGVRFKLFLIAYLVFRLFLDFIKPGFRFSFGLSTIQLACIIGLIYYCNTIFKLIFNFSTLVVKNE